MLFVFQRLVEFFCVQAAGVTVKYLKPKWVGSIIITALGSYIKYCFYHSKIIFISLPCHVIFSMLANAILIMSTRIITIHNQMFNRKRNKCPIPKPPKVTQCCGWQIIMASCFILVSITIEQTFRE